MNPLRRFASKRQSVDRLPEEQDDLVAVLRQAYSSTPVPENLIASIQAAVVHSRAESVSPLRPMNRLFQAGIVAVPACAVLLVAGVMTGVLGGGKAAPAHTAASAGIVVWTNDKSGATLDAAAAYVSPRKVRFSYSLKSAAALGKRSSGSGEVGSAQHSSGAINIPALPNAYDLAGVPVKECPGGSRIGPAAQNASPVCFTLDTAVRRQGSRYVLIERRAKWSPKWGWFNPSPAPAQNVMQRAPSDKVILDPFIRPSHRAENRLSLMEWGPRLCPRYDTCWLIRINPIRHPIPRSNRALRGGQ